MGCWGKLCNCTPSVGIKSFSWLLPLCICDGISFFSLSQASFLCNKLYSHSVISLYLQSSPDLNIEKGKKNQANPNIFSFRVLVFCRMRIWTNAIFESSYRASTPLEVIDRAQVWIRQGRAGVTCVAVDRESLAVPSALRILRTF